MERILLCLAHMSGREMDFIKEAFDRNCVAPHGPNANGFELEADAQATRLPQRSRIR